MTKLSNTQYGRLLYQLISKANQRDSKPAITAFAQLIVARRLKRRLPQIISAFEREYNRDKGITSATVTSAQPLSAGVISQIKKQLATTTNTIVELENVIDPALIGGVQIQIGDTITDNSIAGQLEQLRAHVS